MVWWSKNNTCQNTCFQKLYNVRIVILWKLRDSQKSTFTMTNCRPAMTWWFWVPNCFDSSPVNKAWNFIDSRHECSVNRLSEMFNSCHMFHFKKPDSKLVNAIASSNFLVDCKFTWSVWDAVELLIKFWCFQANFNALVGNKCTGQTVCSLDNFQVLNLYRMGS